MSLLNVSPIKNIFIGADDSVRQSDDIRCFFFLTRKKNLTTQASRISFSSVLLAERQGVLGSCSQLVPYCHRISLSRLVIGIRLSVPVRPSPISATSVFAGNSSLAPLSPLPLDDTTTGHTTRSSGTPGA